MGNGTSCRCFEKNERVDTMILVLEKPINEKEKSEK